MAENKWCKRHGFQRERGFEIDEIMGELKLTVVSCHSDSHPRPKQRVIMPTADGDLRVHDYCGIARTRGKIIPHDRWSLPRAVGSRLLRLLEQVLDLVTGRAREKIRRALP